MAMLGLHDTTTLDKGGRNLLIIIPLKYKHATLYLQSHGASYNQNCPYYNSI